MHLKRRFEEWMFSIPEPNRSTAGIVLWWELRRVPYNLIVGTTGLVSLSLVYFFSGRTNAIEPEEDVVEPIALLLAPVAMDVCYTAGWAVEAFLYRSYCEGENVLGPDLLRFGLRFSLFLVTLPAMFWAGYWILQVAGIVK
ncbi:MAG TPA: hypothetical protein VKF81_02965 [Blastocatellia bacterium]|nr:hypothetical protein [Blastocatellia bacterium]